MKQSTIHQSLFLKVFIQLTTNPKLKVMENNIVKKTANCLLLDMYAGRKEVLTIF